MGMLFGKASGRTFKRFGTTIRFRNRNPLKVKSSDTHPFLIESPSEAFGEEHTHHGRISKAGKGKSDQVP